MKIIENNDKEDFAGRYPICSVKCSELVKLVDWLYRNYQGYKFGIVIDVYGEEYPVPEKPSDFKVDVLFLDEVFDEAVAYIGLDEAQKHLDEIRSGRR